MGERIQRITLVRHGRPTVSLRESVAGRAFLDFVQRYEAACIDPRSRPPEQTRQRVTAAQVVWTSDRPRAVHSAQILGIAPPARSVALFREVDCWSNFPSSWSFSAIGWIVLTRFLWPLGYGTPSETPVMARNRAQQAAHQLMAAAQTHGSIALVAHGGINTLIARELRQRGWQGPRQPNLVHWGSTTYQRRSLPTIQQVSN